MILLHSEKPAYMKCEWKAFLFKATTIVFVEVYIDCHCILNL
jgi:hypothetical protein